MWFMLNTCFSSGYLNSWNMLGRVCLCNRPPVKTLGTEFLLSFPDRQHFTHGVTIGFWRKYAPSVWLHREREFLEACVWFPPNFGPCTFSLCWFCFVFFHCNKSYVSPVSVCEYSWWVTKPTQDLQFPSSQQPSEAGGSSVIIFSFRVRGWGVALPKV